MRTKLWRLLLTLTFSAFLMGSAYGAAVGETSGLITLEEDSAASVCGGFSTTYYLEVTNDTGQEESITMSAVHTWPTLIEPTALVLGDGASEYIAVTVQVPLSASPGDLDAAVITASGQISASSDSVTLTTHADLAQGWADAANSPEGRGTYGHSLVYWDGKLYKIGGAGYVDDVLGYRPWLDIYDIATDTWQEGPDMNTGRAFIDCQAIDLTGSAPKIYCAGGYRSSAKQALFIYDINAASWSTGEELPEPRYGYASIAHDDKYYVIGGIDSTAVNTMYVYDPDTDTWDTTKSPMAAARSHFSAGLLDGKIVAAGGFDATPLSSVEVYDLALDAWSAAEPLPTGWVNAADGVVADRFLIMVGGGETGTTSGSNRAHLYDIDQDSWRLLPIFNHGIYGAEGAGDGSDFWVVSGRIYEDEAFSNSTYTTRMVQCGGECIPVSGADFTWDPPSPLSGELVTFTATVAQGTPPLDYLWDFGDASYGSTGTIDHTYTSSGTYTVELAVTNCYGGSTAIASHDVIVLGRPEISVDPTSLQATLKPDETQDQTVQICNTGENELTWSIEEAQSQVLEVTDLPWVSASPTSGVLAAGNCQDVVVSFDASGLETGPYTGGLKISSNDPLASVTDVALSLTVDEGKIINQLYLPLITR